MLQNYIVFTSVISSPGNAINIIFSFFSFILVLALAYFTSKFIATKGTTINSGRNMEIIDALNIGNNKKILMIKIVDKVYIVATNNTNFNLIDIIKDEDIIEDITNIKVAKPAFDNFLKNKLESFNSKDNTNINILDEDFTNKNMSNLKSRIENLKKNNILSSIKDED